MRAILLIADELGLDVIAEGIERPDQLEELVRLGCAHGQGYHFARPMPAERFWALLGAPGAASRPTGSPTRRAGIGSLNVGPQFGLFA